MRVTKKTSDEYWREREKEHIKAGLKADKQLRVAEKERFDVLTREIEKEINDFYSRYAKTEGISIIEARKRASAIDMEAYEKKAAKYVKNRTFSKEANQEMRLYNATMKVNRLELLKSNIGLHLVDAYQDIEDEYRDILTNTVRDEFERLSGILGDTIRNSEKFVQNVVNASFQNATFSDRVWQNQSLLKSELDQLITRGIVQGKHPKVLARDLRKVVGASRYNSERLLVTETARVQTDVQKKSFEDIGYEQYLFVAEPTACPICRKLDDGKPKKVQSMMPGRNAPPMHPWCRCSTSAFADRETLEKRLKEIEEGEEEV